MTDGAQLVHNTGLHGPVLLLLTLALLVLVRATRVVALTEPRWVMALMGAAALGWSILTAGVSVAGFEVGGWGSDLATGPRWASRGAAVEVLGTRFSTGWFALVLLAVIATAGLRWVERNPALRGVMLAATSDPEAAALVGIDTRVVAFAAAALAGLLARVAMAFAAPTEPIGSGAAVAYGATAVVLVVGLRLAGPIAAAAASVVAGAFLATGDSLIGVRLGPLRWSAGTAVLLVLLAGFVAVALQRTEITTQDGARRRGDASPAPVDLRTVPASSPSNRVETRRSP